MSAKRTHHKAPGKSFRKGLSMLDLMWMFPDDEAAERFFVKSRWPKGACCVKCGSVNVQERPTRKPQPYRCRDCRKDFSVRTDSLMHNSPLGYRVWAIAIYLMTTNIKGVSSMRLHRELGIAGI
jgi:transposase-like protein